MEIAPRVDERRWWQLTLDDPSSGDWTEAIGILKARIHSRYLEPARQLVTLDEPKPASRRTYEFSIMAINCLLVETLESFAKGIVNTCGRSEELFKSFLTSHSEFGPPFTEALAQQLYRDVRCGILHIGQTQNDARIWSIGPLVCEDGNSVRLNRTLFHEKLAESFRAYLAALADPTNGELRSNFRIKMDFIARKPAV